MKGLNNDWFTLLSIVTASTSLLVFSIWNIQCLCREKWI